MSKIPILVCGRNPIVAKGVREGMVPEYDVIHICLDPAKAVTEVPLILSGGTPSNHKDNLGSQNYTRVPIAIAAGGGYSNEQFDAVKKAADENKDAMKVVWLRADMSKVAGPPKEGEYDAYAKKTAGRVKDWLKNENLEGKEGGVYYF
ncbi:hypothetical protein P280DRAFT_508680 [Massarina eburnea CBS 473.64]|uniref:Uncharacterized protein n=1 Tax=Massarina eburnea CBS 473.64 TaxID=1395130 RepID=A0A6A6RWZ5_9PLEO|nr:hypothetical protein P280DRAFT_508680 [Massarina eburnea CBS 473.64]